MALTKVSRSLLNTGVADSSDATAISIDSSENVTLAGDLDLADSKKIKLGGSDDLQIYHDGSNSFINEGGTGGLKILSGDVYIRNPSDEDMIHATSGGAVRLYYDNASRLYTHTSGVKLDEHLYLADSKKIFLGAGDDLSIYHDGSNSYIEDSGTGDLYLSAADNFIVRKYGGSEVMIKGTADGAAELYYDDSKKLETVTGGVTVTGTLTATSLAGNVTTAAQTGITSLLATDIKIGEDDQTKIDFETADEIHFYAANAEQVYIADGVFGPQTDADVDLGTSGVEFKDLFLDGTAHIDTLDVDANATIAGTLGVTGVTTSNAGIVVDELTIDGDTITATDDFIIDATTNIFLDADGGEVVLRDGGSNFGYFHQDSNNFEILSTRSDGDIIIKGNDGGSTITALTLDMSAAGKATFNNAIVAQADSKIQRNDDTDYSATGEPAGILTLYNSNGSDGGGVNNYSSLEFNTGDGATSQGFINYVRTADNQGKFTFSQRTGSSTYAEAVVIDNSGILDAQGFKIDGAQGSDGQVITSTGSGVAWEDVSAGPTHKTFGTGSIMIGDNATGTINAANRNTGVGIDIFAALTTGDANTVMGNQSGEDLTSGEYNTFYGDLSGQNITDGALNTALGYYTLASQTSGTGHNTALGAQALALTTSGTVNTAAGLNAMLRNTTGAENVAVGAYSLSGGVSSGTTVSASNNVAIGVECMKLNTTGTQNAALGKAAMITNTTGNYNTALGPYALKLNQTGSNNTAIGYEALMSYTGGDNTALGYRAGKAADQSRNTYIGYDAGTAQNGSADNMAIGYMALSRQTTGANGNIAIGNYAGRAVVSSASTSQLVAIGHNVANNGSAALAGYQNCFIGYNIASASGLAGAFRNTALGANAMTDLTTGDNNTSVGNMAGNSITTATNNLCLGYQAGESGSPSGTLTTGSNTIVLGDDNIGALYCTQSSINTSDRRDKADITNFTDGLDFIKKMQPVTYKWDRRSWYLPRDEDGNITDEDITKVTPNGSKKENVTHVGFIAQDVETLEKEIGFASDNTNRLLTNLTEDGNRYGMKYERLVTVLVNAVKDLSTKLDAAETRIKTLEDA